MPDDGLTELLKMAIVRITIGDRSNGTGFFVAPAYVVTCTHVLEPWLDASQFSRPALAIIDANGKSHEIVDIDANREKDLSLIKLGTADTSVAVALLNDAVEVDDRLWTFGFTDPHPEGVPATFTVEGTSGSPTDWIKFSAGQAEPGMSGAPLLDLSTGAVCGVMKRSRSVDQDLGGFGIKASTLYAIFDRVPNLNSAAHSGESPWLQRLNPEQRRRVQPGIAAFAESDYVEFVVLIGQQDDDWRVTAKMHPPGKEVASVRVDLNCVRKEVPRLFRAWRAHGRIEDADQAQLLGRVLYRSILPNPLAHELERMAFQDKRPVHISLCFDSDMDDDLKHLPWEQLYVERRPGVIPSALGATTQLTLTRVLNPEPDKDPQPAASSCSVLVVAGPQAVQASKRLVDDLDKLDGIVTVGADVKMTLDALEDKVTKGGVTVLHYIGRGRYDRQHDQIALSSGEDSEEPDYISGEELARALRLKPPRVVVLQACSRPDVVPADPTVLAPPLLDGGVEAVIAFQFPLTPDDAVAYSKRLYEELANGQSIRVAVQESRKRLPPWSRPALFMARPADSKLVPRVSAPVRSSFSWGG